MLLKEDSSKGGPGCTALHKQLQVRGWWRGRGCLLRATAAAAGEFVLVWSVLLSGDEVSGISKGEGIGIKSS